MVIEFGLGLLVGIVLALTGAGRHPDGPLVGVCDGPWFASSGTYWLACCWFGGLGGGGYRS